MGGTKGGCVCRSEEELSQTVGDEIVFLCVGPCPGASQNQRGPEHSIKTVKNDNHQTINNVHLLACSLEMDDLHLFCL